MIVKVNQVTKIDQLKFILGADIVGIGVSIAPPLGGPWINLLSAQAIIDALRPAQVALSFREADGLSADFVAKTLVDLAPDYFEFTPVDFAKRQTFEAQLEMLIRLPIRKIANGFFAQEDDMHMIDEAGPYRNMMSAGVECFQFEVTSTVQSSMQLSSSNLARLSDFFKEIPVLVTDNFRDLGQYPLRGQQGYFLNVAPAKDGENYDYSQVRFPISKLVRVLKTRI